MFQTVGKFSSFIFIIDAFLNSTMVKEYILNSFQKFFWNFYLLIYCPILVNIPCAPKKNMYPAFVRGTIPYLSTSLSFTTQITYILKLIFCMFVLSAIEKGVIKSLLRRYLIMRWEIIFNSLISPAILLFSIFWCHVIRCTNTSNYDIFSVD